MTNASQLLINAYGWHKIPVPRNHPVRATNGKIWMIAEVVYPSEETQLHPDWVQLNLISPDGDKPSTGFGIPYHRAQEWINGEIRVRVRNP